MKATERPILFSAPMVRAILDGRKTVTRRIVKPQPVGPLMNVGSPSEKHGWHRLNGRPGGINQALSVWNWPAGSYLFSRDSQTQTTLVRDACPYGVDRLWVKESCWLLFADLYRGDGELEGVVRVDPRSQDPGDPPAVWCAVDGPLPAIPPNDHGWRWARRNSIHMPRYASRIMLDVVSVRVERLHDITEDDALAEGIDADGPIGNLRVALDMGYARYQFAALWDVINGKRAPWASNPWVWRVEFRRDGEVG